MSPERPVYFLLCVFVDIKNTWNHCAAGLHNPKIRRLKTQPLSISECDWVWRQGSFTEESRSGWDGEDETNAEKGIRVSASELPDAQRSEPPVTVSVSCLSTQHRCRGSIN